MSARAPAFLALLLVGACTLVAGLDDLAFTAGAVAGAGGEVTSAGGAEGGSGGHGGSRFETVSFTDDELEGEFGEGTFAGASYDGTHLALDLGEPSGTFTSRVFDAGAETAKWLTLEWSPEAPYGKPLPDGGAAETGYLMDAADMTGNILLLHLDGTGSAAHGTLLPEASGRGNNPSVWHASMGAMSYVPGVFAEAIDSTLDDYLRVDVPAGSDFDFGTGDFTWGLWAKTTQDCTGAKSWLGIENALDVHLWLGCWADDAACCPNTPASYSGGYFVTGPTDDTCYCGESPVADDAWHHVVMVKAGHADAEVRLYVDGVRESTTTQSFEMPAVFDGSVFTVGAFDFHPPDVPVHQAFGQFDEVFVLTRALTDADVAAAYRRAKLRLRFQVRVCSDAACADDPPFSGPDGRNDAHFVDTGATAPAQVSLGAAPTGRYFQYRAELETAIAGGSPAFRHVTVTAER